MTSRHSRTKANLKVSHQRLNRCSTEPWGMLWRTTYMAEQPAYNCKSLRKASFYFPKPARPVCVARARGSFSHVMCSSEADGDETASDAPPVPKVPIVLQRLNTEGLAGSQGHVSIADVSISQKGNLIENTIALISSQSVVVTAKNHGQFGTLLASGLGRDSRLKRWESMHIRPFQS